MESRELYIKNMVCPRCIEAVAEIFVHEHLEAQVELGKVSLTLSISDAEKEKLGQLLRQRGFELLESGKSALISQIKTLIIELVHHQENSIHENLSTFLSEKLNQEYTGLSKLFSGVEGITIERYYTRQKIEKVKEYLFYDELSLSEIAFRMGYSSVAYLSAQFKKETGMTPSEFKKNGQDKRRSLDGI
ncbi:AraC family transcriptional regulator [Algoriphagus sp. CAU 1675]|uniref:helix-turn-helix domain-containing protein n=1 Tax=Algoriphagus sp. CAU 1675 TaxID=3032597 RepID=UPI0023DCD0EE|nr:AraC family transcriptional regulator [Algoriphagus sp. CAU 1675]MDF2157658.1 AraC family transcriptional regulator [Algoriphagus sp. CAU 1675]